MKYEIFPVGDQAVTISLSNLIDVHHHQKIMAMSRWINENSFEGLCDVTIAYSSLTIAYQVHKIKKDELASCYAFVKSFLEKALLHADDHRVIDVRRHEIPVCYDKAFALDLAFISAYTKLEHDEIISLHTSRIYKVFMIGFLPGFPYLAKVDNALAVPRKQKPDNISAGSVGIAGVQTGIYPNDSPGGWQIIGKTPLRLFDPDRYPPIGIQPGDEVQFKSISINEFKSLSALV